MTTQEELQNVCINIRYLRAKHSLSRTAMAGQLGITVKTLDILEQGIWPERISIGVLFRVWTHFGIPAKILLTTRLEETESL